MHIITDTLEKQIQADKKGSFFLSRMMERKMNGGTPVVQKL
jgi:hypothetical protein